MAGWETTAMRSTRTPPIPYDFQRIVRRFPCWFWHFPVIPNLAQSEFQQEQIVFQFRNPSFQVFLTAKTPLKSGIADFHPNPSTLMRF